MTRAFGIVALLVASLATAQPLSTSDPRIQLLSYNAEQVVPLDVAPGYAAVVEFSADEVIDSVVIGNAGVWQITEVRSGDKVVVKPLPGAVPTNLIVLTDKRRYVFLLQPGSEGQSSFVLRFTYPAAVQVYGASAPVATYRLSGDRGLFPTAMFDDGKKTTVTWGRNTPLPAVFTINGRQESIVNGRMVGNDYIIEGTAARYRLRYGLAQAVAVRRLAPARR